MKSLFGKPDNNRFSEKLVNNDQQKYINDSRLDKIKHLLRENHNCSLHSICLVSSRNELFVGFSDNKASLFRNFHKKTDEELVSEINEELSIRILMGDFDA